MLRTRNLFSCLAALVLGGCATVPTGPSVMVLPAQGKPFEVFQADDAVCRQWAAQQIGATRADRLRFLTAYLGLELNSPRVRYYARRIVRKSRQILDRIARRSGRP